MSLLKDLDDPKSSKYTFSDFWSVDQAQKEMDDLFAELDAVRERKKQIGIGYYFEKLGDRMRKAITVINEEDANKF